MNKKKDIVYDQETIKTKKSIPSSVTG